MTKRALIIGMLLAALGRAEGGPKVAVLGHFPVEGSLEAKAAHLAEEASAQRLSSVAGASRLKLAFFEDRGSEQGALEAASRAAADPEVVAAVVLGEASASPAVLQALSQAALAVVAASSWQTPRLQGRGVTWLSPDQAALAESAAVYARRLYKASQAAVVDNGAPTAAAAAKAFADRFKALGGKVAYQGEWQGTEWGLTRTAKDMKAHWPQVVFFAGEADEAAQLIVAMKAEKELSPATLIGLPHLFENAFFDGARLKAVRATALFPAPDYRGGPALMRLAGWAPAKGTLEWKAYVAYAWKAPGRWTAMFYDACQLALKAVEEAGMGEAGAGWALPTREEAAAALAKTTGYKGIRGVVKFNEKREPTDPRAMVYFALNKVNKKEMQWREKAYGPPF